MSAEKSKVDSMGYEQNDQINRAADGGVEKQEQAEPAAPVEFLVRSLRERADALSQQTFQELLEVASDRAGVAYKHDFNTLYNLTSRTLGLSLTRYQIAQISFWAVRNITCTSSIRDEDWIDFVLKFIDQFAGIDDKR